MLQSCWKSRVRVSVLGGALGLITLGAWGVGSATAQQDTLTDNAWTRMEKQISGSVMRSLGVVGPDDPVIEYRERSPLVVPPSRDLPPPQANAATTNPAWPVDPDAKRAKDRAAAKKKRLSSGAGFQDSDTLGNAISPTELNAPGSAASSGSTAGIGRTFDPRDGRPLQPSELGFAGFGWRALGFGQNKEEVGTFTHEPPRATLVAPPPGYQTPSPAYPYGVTKRQEQLKTRNYDPAVGAYQ